MNPLFNAGLLLNAVLFWVVSGKTAVKDGEVEVKLQFLEYELEDYCVTKNEAEWKFLNGSDKNLRKLLDADLKESEFYKHELELLQKHLGKKFSNDRLQRLVDVFSHPGAALLGTTEFKEYRDYSIKLQELIGTMKISCKENDTPPTDINEASSNSSSPEECPQIDARMINKVLFDEKDEQKLKDVWIKWFKTLEKKNKKTKYDFVQQLSILDLEAEQNGEEELTDYWLKQTDTTWVNYDGVKNIWSEIRPLYEKIKNFMSSLVSQKFGRNSSKDQNIPVHVLGSLVSYDWITAAEKLGAFDTSDAYTALRESLKQKKVGDLYKAADNQTAELKLGYLPQSFFEKSQFNISSQTCQHKIMKYCERENVHRGMFCADEVPSVREYIEVNENVMRLKCQLLGGKEEEENGFLFREGPLDSVLHEAMEGISSIRAFWPEYLESQNLLTNQSHQQKAMLSVLITALHVLPPLPYYLASDLWRINALREMDAIAGENTADTTTETIPSSSPRNLRKRVAAPAREEGQEQEEESEATKTYDTFNLTKDWWSYRHMYQGIQSPDGGFYEDYLRDSKIIWNRPYLSKFLGKILQFQILEKSANLTSNLSVIQTMLQKGKSQSWENLLEEAFNITEISVAPFLKYFKPLEEFLDKGIKFKNYTRLFSFDDFDFVSQGFSFNGSEEGEKPAEGSDALFFSLAAIAAAGVIALIVTTGRRRYKRRQRLRERKRMMSEV